MTTRSELSCLALDSPRWHELDRAYGKAADIPDLLRQLAGLPSSTGEVEPWFPLWSALAHRADVAEAVLALTPELAAEFLEWQENR